MVARGVGIISGLAPRDERQKMSSTTDDRVAAGHRLSLEIDNTFQTSVTGLCDVVGIPAAIVTKLVLDNFILYNPRSVKSRDG